MIGTEGVVLQDRDRRLMGALETMCIVDRDQAMAVAGFHSITRANTRLLKLKNAGLLHRLFVGTQVGTRKALYTLSPKGAATVGVRLWHLPRRTPDRLVVDPFIEHQLTVNALRILVCHRRLPEGFVVKGWQVFQQPIAPSFPIAPDGYFKIEHVDNTHSMFLEVDRGTEGQRIWKNKILIYLRLAASGEFTKRFGQPRFRVLVAAHSERRLMSIRKSVQRVTDKIFWFATFQSISNEGFWSPVWFRTKQDQKLPLI
jgi:hypothetical protein